MHVHLLDATFELFRAYYGQPQATVPDGAAVGAVRGLLRSTVALLRDPMVTHLAAATDHVIESFRNQLFDGYKTGAGLPADLWSQFPLAEQALRALGVIVWPMVEFEADDALATAAHRFAPRAERVVILSPDKDLAQCVRGDRVVMHDRIRATTYDEAAVWAKFGVPPASIPDWLALVGDSADGLPGVPGWGSKTSATLLSIYGHVDAIPDDADAWPVAVRGAARLAKSLREHRRNVQLYRTLATLRLDVPISEEIDDLRWRGAPPGFADFCAQLGFDALPARVPRWSTNAL